MSKAEKLKEVLNGKVSPLYKDDHEVVIDGTDIRWYDPSEKVWKSERLWKLVMVGGQAMYKELVFIDGISTCTVKDVRGSMQCIMDGLPSKSFTQMRAGVAINNMCVYCFERKKGHTVVTMKYGAGKVIPSRGFLPQFRVAMSTMLNKEKV